MENNGKGIVCLLWTHQSSFVRLGGGSGRRVLRHAQIFPRHSPAIYFRWRLRFLAFVVGRSASSTLQVYPYISKLQNRIYTYETYQTCRPLLPSLPSTRPPRFAPFSRKVRPGTITDRLVILQKELESFLEQEYVSFNIR